MSSSSSRSTSSRHDADDSQQPSVEPMSTDLFVTGTSQHDVEMSEAQSDVGRRQSVCDEHSDAVSFV